jgi:hypothetical protein
MRQPIILAILLYAGLDLALAQGHPIEFWHEIAQNHHTVPPGSDMSALSNELVDMLASPDPERRDEIAYSTLASWIYQTRVIAPQALQPLTGRLLANLTDGIGERAGNRVLERSFSALVLSVIVARDNAEPFLSATEYRRIEEAALTYLAQEQDVRGYDETLGWIHSAAHTADLLKFLARSRYLQPAEQTRVLDAISRKLSGASVVFMYGEDERLARAVLSIVNRADFDLAQFQAWTSRSKPASAPDHPTIAQLRASQNAKNMFAKLLVVLDGIEAPADAVRAARASVQAALQGAF